MHISNCHLMLVSYFLLSLTLLTLYIKLVVLYKVSSVKDGRKYDTNIKMTIRNVHVRLVVTKAARNMTPK